MRIRESAETENSKPNKHLSEAVGQVMTWQQVALGRHALCASCLLHDALGARRQRPAAGTCSAKPRGMPPWWVCVAVHDVVCPKSREHGADPQCGRCNAF